MKKNYVAICITSIFEIIIYISMVKILGNLLWQIMNGIERIYFPF